MHGSYESRANDRVLPVASVSTWRSYHLSELLEESVKVVTALTLPGLPHIGAAPLPRKAFFSSFDQIALIRMSDRFVRRLERWAIRFPDDGPKRMRDLMARRLRL